MRINIWIILGTLQSPSMQDMLYEITDAGKAALRAVGGAAE